MPQLNGVETVSDTVIEYGGYRYEKTEEMAQVGDIVLNDYGNYYEVFADSTGINDEDHAVPEVSIGDPVSNEKYVYKSYPVFRRTSPVSIATTLAEKRAELERLQAEIAELVAQEAEERRIKVGDWIRVYSSNIVGKVIEDDESPLPFHVKSLHHFNWYRVEEVEKITPAGARSALIAQIDAVFDGKEGE